MSQARSSKPRLPVEIYAALVETLFGTVGSFVSGIFGGLLVPVIAWAKTRDPIFFVCTAVILALSVLRLIVLLKHQRADPDKRLEQTKAWEVAYSIGAIGFMTAVGVTAAILFRMHHDEMTTLYGVVITLGMLSALAGRNAGRPLIVYGQTMGVCGPLCVVLFTEFSPWYWGLAAILILIMTSVKSTTKFLNGMLVSALLNGHEARLQRTRFSTALDSMSHGLCMGDAKGNVTVVNSRLRYFFKIDDDGEELTVVSLAKRIAAAGRLPAKQEAVFVKAWQSHIAKRDSWVFSETIGERVYDFRCEPMEMGGFVVVVEDVTVARAATREIEHLAHFDSLTGLPNRFQFHNHLTETMERPLAKGQYLALLSVDLDQFKEVNDTRGHPTGDELLRLVAMRLRQVTQDADLIARFGGDEFQVLIRLNSESVRNVERNVERIARRVIDTLSEPYSIDSNMITIGASIGCALSPRDAVDPDEMLRCADMALYRAKAEGRGACRTFSPEMDTAMRRRREVEQMLRTAIAHDGLEIHYQPVVDSRTGKIVACEALVRMRDPVQGMISPGEFIPVAEESGLIVQLGDWVLRRACKDATLWPRDVRVAVNFSPKQFVIGKNVYDDIKHALDSAGLEPHRLEVEITESTIIEAKDPLRQLREISEAGVKISLDDFGTGYSSLSYLRQFPVDKIKIDRSFCDDIKSRASQAVIGSVSILAKLLNVDLVIEGVETKAQLEAIKSWNVSLVQGYYYSKPKPLAEILPLLKSEAPFSGDMLQVA